MPEAVRSAASFRDPSGFVFERDGRLFRQVNRSGRDDFDHLVASGLADELIGEGLLIPHRPAEGVEPCDPASSYRVIEPDRLPFVSYPYEWCFGALRDAALLTLRIQRRAIGRGMSLKDASAFNVQFAGGRPVFIDTLSFERYDEGRPWAAYRQFCQHFLAPLALMGLVDPRMVRALRHHLDGIPLDLAARILPARSRLRPSLLLHVHLHAMLQSGRTTDGKAPAPSRRPFGRRAMLGLIDGLESAVGGLRWDRPGSAWSGYYDDNSYRPEGFERKRRFVAAALEATRPATAWDLGANTGLFARLAADAGAFAVAFDADPACVERCYREASAGRDERLLPLVMDLTDPSPDCGWDGRERLSLARRGPADAVLALALVHHLAIAANVPLPGVAATMARLGRTLVVEFVPKSDPQARRLLAAREDVFDDYHRDGFEAAFRAHFDIDRAEAVEGSDRILYRMRRRSEPAW